MQPWRPALISALALAGLFLPATNVAAGTLDIIVESTTAEPGTAAQFDILLQNNTGAAVTIGGFSVDVLLSDSTFAAFTAIDQATVAPYIFSLTGSFPPGFEANLLPMEASGSDFAASGGQVVAAGETWGLAHVRYVIDPAAPIGTVLGLSLQLTPIFLPPPGGTTLTDDQGNPVDFNLVDGTITVSTEVIPEPSSVVLLGIAGVVGLAGTRLARRRARRA